MRVHHRDLSPTSSTGREIADVPPDADPMPVLLAQRYRAKGEAVAQMKADGIEYEARLELLTEVTHPKPLAELLDVAGRFSRIFWARGDLALVASTSADRRPQRTVIDPSRPGAGRARARSTSGSPGVSRFALGKERALA